jgi:V/A-type H+-transporting ATPase subunit E
MGCKELIESLRAAGDERIKTIRAEAEQEAERVRADAARRIAEVQAGHARMRSSAAAAHAERYLAEANGTVRQQRLLAERALADRLYGLAGTSLSTLRNVGYRDMFGSFVLELPRFTWKTIRVNPADGALAREHFPGAEILFDKAITGGLEAISDEGQVKVVNTFEKRLERMWEEMLPEIMKEVMEQCP